MASNRLWGAGTSDQGSYTRTTRLRSVGNQIHSLLQLGRDALGRVQGEQCDMGKTNDAALNVQG